LTGNTSTLLYSVVVPFYDEAAAAPRLLEEILAVLEKLDGPAECLCIDDGSRDATGAILSAFAARPGSPVRVLTFPENRGQAAALLCGFREAKGQIVITLDGDGQNDPGDIPELLGHLQSADLVCGIRADRHDSWLRKTMSRWANAVRNRVLGDGMRDSGCALKVMRREVCAALIPIRTLYSFIPALAVAAGFRVAQVPIRHRARQGGASSYGLRAFLWRPFLDMLGLLWFRNRCILTTEDCALPGVKG
jgi:glycosyltransferase involved in cell wall biosynthesis